MPGFVDTHRHMWEGILRNILPDASLDEYVKIVQLQLGPHYRPEDVYAANFVSALGAIEVGITTILDWSHIQNTPEHTDAAIKALADSGIRAVFAYGTPSNGLADFRDDPRHRYPGDMRRLRKQYFSSDDQLLTLAPASLSNPPDRVAAAWAVAREVARANHLDRKVGTLTPGKEADLILLRTDHFSVTPTNSATGWVGGD
jgi:5-methylthioadenosine/S-adenosylhomocysteine deaminase